MQRFYPTENVKGLQLFASDKIATINILSDQEFGQNYRIRFEKRENAMVVKKLTMGGRPFLQKSFTLPEDFLEYSVHQFDQILHNNRQQIKHLSLLGPGFAQTLKNHDFGFENLPNVNRLCLDSMLDVTQILSKIRLPLLDLFVSQEDSCVNLASTQQIYHVTHVLNAEYLKLDMPQFSSLAATILRIHIGCLTDDNIYEFICAWQNGENRREVKLVDWCHLEETNFDKQRLFQRFGKPTQFHREDVEVNLPHLRNANKYAKLMYARERLGAGSKFIETLTFVERVIQ